jgi:hypothetical protein
VSETIETIRAEQAGRWAVTALTCDLEFWARAAARDGWVGVADLLAILDSIRRTSAEDRAATICDVGSGLDHAGVAS